MPPREKEFDAVCFVIDVGCTSTQSRFLNSALRCATQLVQRKLFSESPDKFGLVLCGTTESVNDLNYDGVYVMENEAFVSADWNLLKYIGTEIKGTTNKSDWLDGVIVALDYMKRNSEGKKVKIKKIVLFSDLGNPVNSENFELILTGMIMESVEFTFIGPDWQLSNDETLNGQDSKLDLANKSTVHLEGRALIGQLVERTDGLLCSIDDALASLVYKERRTKRPFPWKTVLDIGPDIKINVTGYFQVRREAPKSWKKCLSQKLLSSDDCNTSNITEIKPETMYVRLSKEDDKTEIPVDNDNLISSYRYGRDLITISDEDKANFSYDSGPKSMSVLGFVPLDSISQHYLLGDGCMKFMPLQGDEHSVIALSALAEAMYSLKRGALVRRVYRSGCIPKISLLAPEMVQDSNNLSNLILILIELPFIEDMRHYQFAPLEKNATITNQQKGDKDEITGENIKNGDREKKDSLIDELIDSMMLANKTDDTLRTEEILNPYYQHLYECLTQRAMWEIFKHGSPDLPSVPKAHINKLMKLDTVDTENVQKILETIQTLFPLSIVNNSSRKRKYDELESLTHKSRLKGDSSILKFKSEHVNQFEKCLDNGEKFIIAARRLESAIIDSLVKLKKEHSNWFLFDGSGDFNRKALYECLASFRIKAMENLDPGRFNDFLQFYLKPLLADDEKNSIMTDLSGKNLGLITSDEDILSTISEDVAKSFFSHK